ncbi:MAG: S41 family peptidase [Candidatus Bathyarchaeota archaeon]|nr:MAG: S41 family peptidase [Candidatus Bathyarchaeota archaeon]
MVEKKMKKTVRMAGPGKRVIKHRVLPRELPELKELTPETINETITGIQKAIRENYVFPEQADDLCRSLEGHYAIGDYDRITDPKTLCEQLTQHLRDVVNDKHLQVLLPKDMPHIGRRAVQKPSDRQRIVEHGLTKVEILPGNVGYINVTMFNPLSDSADRINGAMQFVKNTDALIIDLRKCRGGSADSINFHLSYFFDPQTPLTLVETYFRPHNQTFRCQTTRTPFHYAKPVFVLTSGFTFSGAEHFAFALKIHKRATLVGANTGGGAHPVAIIGLDTGLLFKVPIGRTYDPETNEDWEGTGVAPDIRCPEDDALTEALNDTKK